MMMWDEAMAKRVGDRIRVLRAERSLSQETLAYRAGITKNQVQLIEAGRSAGRDTPGPSNPKLGTLVGIAQVFDMTVAEFLAGADV
ncbi:MAG: XRE family transcriptional regulator [Comamonadaceae bacterium]|nr:MAG: XRE family transcriptional regulator [Comamonadaceae bacterium]